MTAMRLQRLLISGVAIAAISVGVTQPALAKGKCELVGASIPFVLKNGHAQSTLKLNGQNADFIVDTGAFWSTVTAADAQRLKLTRVPTPPGFLYTVGIGGETPSYIFRADTVEFLGVALKNIEFITAGTDFGAGLLGQNVLFVVDDLDLDVSNGLLRLVKAKNCSGQPLAYWAFANGHYEEAHLLHEEGRYHRPRVEVTLNGKHLVALLDTGAAQTVVARPAAKRAGIDVGDDSVTALGAAYGVGNQSVAAWKAPVKELKIGTETIQNTYVTVINQSLVDVDMLLGLDFIAAHHLLISYSQQKVYMTYNGGRVYSQAEPPKSIQEAQQQSDEPALDSASAYFKRAQGHEQKGEYAYALKDYDKAVSGDGDNVDYRIAQARFLYRHVQGKITLNALNALLEKSPDSIDALIMRMNMSRRYGEAEQVKIDRARLLSLVQPGTLESFTVATSLISEGLFSDALPLLDAWLGAHAEDVRRPDALRMRCLARAMLDVDLDGAAKDCRQYAKIFPKSDTGHQAMGFLHYRQGQFNDALKDFEFALANNDKLGYAHLGLAATLLKLNRPEDAQKALEVGLKHAKAYYPVLQTLGFELPTIAGASSSEESAKDDPAAERHDKKP